ncbi:MAG: c-type cytochrome [Planctomycetes bacterium]|nr:c-type cytochrome [Planctomycetota bacterium]
MQTWRYASRAECQRCHNRWSGPPLAFNAVQLHLRKSSQSEKGKDPLGQPPKDQSSLGNDSNSDSETQLEAFARMGLLDRKLDLKSQQSLANPYDVSDSVDDRARAYLQVNCAHCHRMHAGSSVLSKMHYDLKLENTDMVGVRPSQGTFGIKDGRVIVASDPYRSVLPFRMSKLGGGRMPHIGSSEIDSPGVDLIKKWIAEMKPIEPKSGDEVKPGDATHDHVAVALRKEEQGRISQLKKETTPTAQAILVDQLLNSTSGAFELVGEIDSQLLSGSIRSLVVEKGSKHENGVVRDLFEKFIPADKRVRRLGTSIRPEQILSQQGDAVRGRKVFFEAAGVQCRNCHRIQNEGREVGPDLSKIAAKNSREQLLESLLEPSKRIDPKYVTYVAEIDDGRVVTGLLVKKDDMEVVLKDGQSKEVRVPAGHVERLVPQRQSLMPDLLLRDMTAGQVADLLEYLTTLK